VLALVVSVIILKYYGSTKKVRQNVLVIQLSEGVFRAIGDFRISEESYRRFLVRKTIQAQLCIGAFKFSNIEKLFSEQT
jgi:hypothetical protein